MPRNTRSRSPCHTMPPHSLTYLAETLRYAFINEATTTTTTQQQQQQQHQQRQRRRHQYQMLC
ncbi:unnamed protein product, partial [Ceratitis capitata]